MEGKIKSSRFSVWGAFITVVMIWSTTPLAIKWSGESVGFAFGVSLRMAIGALCALLLTLLTFRGLTFTRRACQAYLAAALGIFGAMSSVYWSAQFIPSGLISVLFGLCPMLVGLLASWWLQEHTFNRFRLLGMGLGFAGLILVFREQLHLGADAAYGVAMMLLAVVLHSVSAVWVKAVDARLPALMLTTGGLLFSLLPFLGLLYVTDSHWPELLPMRAMLSIFYLAIIGSVIGFVLYYYVLERMAAATVAMITLISPVFALLLGSWLNDETVSGQVWAGAGMVLGGLAVHLWGKRVYNGLTGGIS